MVEVRVARSLDALEVHAEAWDQLAVAAPDRLPMLSHAWVSSFLESGSLTGAPWRCLLAYDGAALVGVLPLVASGRGRAGRVRGPADSHTEFAYPLLAADSAPSALAALVDAALELGRGSRMRWYRVREGSPTLASLAALGPRITAVRPVSTRGSLVRTTGPRQDYEATLHRNFHRNLRKAGNRVARDHAVAFRFVGGVEAQHPAHLERFLHLEDSGWKGAAGTAIARSPQLRAFYETLTQRLARRGWLEWHTLELDGEPAASHLAVRIGDALVLPKIAYDETHARYGPGNLLFRELLLRSFDDPAVAEVNCLTDMPWHRNWAMPQVGYADVMVGRRGPVSTAVSWVEMRRPVARAYALRHPRLSSQLEGFRERLNRDRR